jgi:hypothetical protein
MRGRDVRAWEECREWNSGGCVKYGVGDYVDAREYRYRYGSGWRWRRRTVEHVRQDCDRNWGPGRGFYDFRGDHCVVYVSSLRAGLIIVSVGMLHFSSDTQESVL